VKNLECSPLTQGDSEGRFGMVLRHFRNEQACTLGAENKGLTYSGYREPEIEKFYFPVYFVDI
jgi:hypothetical protein